MNFETGKTHAVSLSKPDALDISAYMGGAAGEIGKMAEEMKARLLELIAPRCAYRVEKILSIKDCVVALENGTEITSAQAARELGDCDMAILFVATIGEKPDEEVQKLLGSGATLDAYVLDSVASVAADATLRSFAIQMEAELKKEGRSLTRWLSPGSCDIPLEDQKIIFDAVDASLIEVALTESFLMVPRKSVSGICGLLPHDCGKSVADSNPCELCNKKDCFVRRKKEE